MTAPAIDAALARAEQTLDRIPEAKPVKEPAAGRCARSWQLGDRARSRTGGWEGRIAALEKGGTRATLEAGGIRVTVDVADLEEPAAGGGAVTTSGAIERRAAAARPGRGTRRWVAVRVERQQPAAGPGADRGVVAGPARRPR